VPPSHARAFHLNCKAIRFSGLSLQPPNFTPPSEKSGFGCRSFFHYSTRSQPRSFLSFLPKLRERKPVARSIDHPNVAIKGQASGQIGKTGPSAVEVLRIMETSSAFYDSVLPHPSTFGSRTLRGRISSPSFLILSLLLTGGKIDEDRPFFSRAVGGIYPDLPPFPSI